MKPISTLLKIARVVQSIKLHYLYEIMQCRLFQSIYTYTALPCNHNVPLTKMNADLILTVMDHTTQAGFKSLFHQDNAAIINTAFQGVLGTKLIGFAA